MKVLQNVSSGRAIEDEVEDNAKDTVKRSLRIAPMPFALQEALDNAGQSDLEIASDRMMSAVEEFNRERYDDHSGQSGETLIDYAISWLRRDARKAKECVVDGQLETFKDFEDTWSGEYERWE